MRNSQMDVHEYVHCSHLRYLNHNFKIDSDWQMKLLSALEQMGVEYVWHIRYWDEKMDRSRHYF